MLSIPKYATNLAISEMKIVNLLDPVIDSKIDSRYFVFSERELTFTFSERRYLLSPVRLSSVIRNVRGPYSGGSNISTALGTLAIP